MNQKHFFFISKRRENRQFQQEYLEFYISIAL